ncbi:hypothetical protein [Shouchella rhizosphaerae]|uniref:Uncharacterized protein n=1 Tax=Shouchella rhizosphaerae TaxID=866786 RepID=A0ABZ2CTY7_9BACI
MQVQLAEVTKEVQHQTKRIEEWHKETLEIAKRADAAEDKAELALSRADQALEEIEKERAATALARKERKIDRRWLIGTALTFLGILAPLLIRFYFN